MSRRSPKRRLLLLGIILAAVVLCAAATVLVWINLPYRVGPSVPTICISATLPGASPETMASSIATPLERELTKMPAVESGNTKGDTRAYRNI